MKSTMFQNVFIKNSIHLFKTTKKKLNCRFIYELIFYINKVTFFYKNLEEIH